jgi:hypothetical protein
MAHVESVERPLASLTHTRSKPVSTVIPQQDLEVLLITVDDRILGIQLDQVHHITEMPADFACLGESSRYFVFQDKPLDYVSLWNHLRLKSTFTEYEEIIKLFPQRCQDHEDWLTSLEESIRTGTPFTKSHSPRECAFGKWYYNYHPEDQQLAGILKQFEEPHAEIHGLADRLLGQASRGGRAEALGTLNYVRQSTLAELKYLFTSTQALLKQLIRRVVVIVGGREASCALGADGIREIINVKPGQLTWLQHPDDADQTKTVAGLIILDDGSVASIMNWRPLCHELEAAR